VVEPGVERASRGRSEGSGDVMDPVLREVRARKPRAHRSWSASFRRARSQDDAALAAECATEWLEELARLDLGHDGDHAVAEALRNVRAVRSFLRHPARNGR
jgi:hypothetical protein